MNSLQGRLILGGAIVFAIGFLIAGVAVYGFSRASMVGEFDSALHSQVQALAALTEENDSGVRFAFTEFGFEEFQQVDCPSYFEVWLNGKVLQRSRHLRNGDLKFERGSLDRPSFADLKLPDERAGRQACVTFRPKVEVDDEDDEFEPYHPDDELDDEDDLAHEDDPSPGRVVPVDAVGTDLSGIDFTSGVVTLTWEKPEARVTIAVARDTQDIDRRLASLRWILASVGAAVTLLSSACLVLVIRHGLHPVKAVTTAITEIDEHSLHDRIPADGVPSEITPLVGRLNELLSRLDDAFHRERAFSSNIAHELRTPLAGLRSTLEVYLSRLHDPTEYQDAMQACLRICDQSQNLVENLMSLARVEGKQVSPEHRPVDAHDLFHECWDPLSEQALDKQLKTDFRLRHREVTTDREMLRVILRNVLDNAVSHSNYGGTVEAEISNGGHGLLVRVANTGNRLSAKDADCVFDRLWRGDQARAQTGEHFGLGLTLTKRLTEALGGSVIADIDGDMFRISIQVPSLGDVSV